MPNFFQKGYSTSPNGIKLQKSAGYVNAGAQALNLLNSAYGATNKAGNTLSSAGGVIGSIPTPYTAIAGAALGLAGGIANAFTDTVNQDYVDKIGGQISNLANTTSEAGDFSALQQSYKDLSGSNIDLGDISNWGSKGILSSGLKRERARNLAANALEIAKQSALGNLNQQGRKINQANFANQYSQLLAFGGPITCAIDYANMMDYTALKRKQIDKGLQYAEGGGIYIKPSKKGTFTAAATRHGMGVQEFASKVLANKEDYSPAMVKKANFARNSRNWNAFGGDLMTNGATWDNGFTYIGNGGSHEANPNEGVQVGVDPQGVPNLVEEGEVIWNDYVFSKRLKVPRAFKAKYKLKDGGLLSFADAAKKFAEENKERPNDPISKRGRDALLTALMDQQENVRMKKQKQVSPEGKQYAGGGLVDYNNLNTTGSTENEWKWWETWKNYLPDDTLLNTSPVNTSTENLIDKNFISSIPKSTEITYTTVPKVSRTISEDIKSDKRINNNSFKVSPLRYAPIIGSGIGVLTDALGITNTPDFSSAKALEKAAERASIPSLISATPIGNRLAYRPFDLNYYANQARSNAALTGRSIMNQSSGNIGATTAGLLTLGQNTTTQMGDLFRKAEEYNLEQRAKVEDFNRATDMFNAQQDLTAARANQAEKRQAATSYAANIAQAEALRQEAQRYADTNRSANLTNFLQGLGDIGNENEQRNWLKTLYASGYFGNSPTMERVLYRDSDVLANYMKNNPSAKVDDIVAATGINKKKVTRYFKKKGLTI